WQNTINSATPYSVNDGAMWAGRGLSTELTMGIAARVGALRAQLVPVYTWSQNATFTVAPLVNSTPGSPVYADEWLSRFIDRPQRFGDHAVSRVDLGQSMLGIDYRGAKAGVSSENIWWGPGIDNAIIATNNA